MKRFDYLSYQPVLTINDTKGFKTKFGASLTLLLGLCSFLSLIAFGKDLVLKQNPSVLTAEVYEPVPIILKDDIFFAYSGGLSGGIEIIDFDRYLKFRFGKVDMDGSREGASALFTFYDAVPCMTQKLFQENYLNITNSLIFKPHTYWCLPDNITDYDMKHTYGQVVSSSYDTRLEYCTNTTKNGNHCKPIEEIQRFLNVFFVQTVGKTNLINPTDLENPINTVLFTTLSRVSTLASRQDLVYFKLVDFFSDEGFLLNSYQKQTTYFYEKRENDSVSDPMPPYVFRSLVTVQSYKQIIYRYYTKIQKVASDVGGILKFLLTIVASLNILYAKVKLNEHIDDKVRTSIFNQEKKFLEIVKNNNYLNNKLDKTSKPDNASENSKVQINKNNPDISFESPSSLKEGYKILKGKAYYGFGFIVKRHFFCAKSSRFMVIEKLIDESYKLESMIHTSISNEYLQNLQHTKSAEKEAEYLSLSYRHVFEKIFSRSFRSQSTLKAAPKAKMNEV